MKVLRVLDSSGDRVLTFDDTAASERVEAQELFERLLANGFTAFKVNRAQGRPDSRLVQRRDTGYLDVSLQALVPQLDTVLGCGVPSTCILPRSLEIL